MLNYTISPKCTAPNGAALCLTVNKQTGAVVVWSRLPNNDPSQLWSPVLWVNSNGAQGIALLNVMTNKVIASPSDNSSASLIALDQMDGQRCSWNFFGSTTNYSALQLNQNTDMNLNVAGNGPYPDGTQVLAFNWSGGDPNETWIFSPVIS